MPLNGARVAVIAGASGLVGSALLTQLLEAPEYERVVALVRRPLPLSHPRLEQRVVDFDQLARLDLPMPGADVFCSLGTTIKQAGSQAAFRKVDFEYPLALARLAKAGQARGYYLVSSMGANAQSRIFYSRVKGEVEQAIHALDLRALGIFRPSLLLGERAKARPGEAVAAVVMKAVGPVMAGPLARYRAIEGRTVAAGMLAAARQGTAGVRTYQSDEIQALADNP